MADKEDRDDQQDKQSDMTQHGVAGTTGTGDPGRTPGTAEGDEQTVDEDIRQKESKGEI